MAGLGARGEGEPDELGFDDAQAFDQVVRVEGDGDVLAGELGFELFGSLGIFAGAGVEVQLALGEGEPDRGVAFSHERDAADGFDEFLRSARSRGSAWTRGTASGSWGSRRRPAATWWCGRRFRSR